MCDEGRFTYHELRRDRLASPVVDGLPSSWDRALASAAARLEPLLGGARNQVGVVLSAQHTNEDNYALIKLARDVWQLDNVYVGGRAPAPDRADDILRDADVNPNTAGVTAVMGTRRPGTAAMLDKDLIAGELKALVVLGHDIVLSEAALAAAAKLDVVVVIGAHEVGLARSAHVALPAAAWAEVSGTMTNRQGKVQRLRAAYPAAGQALPAWEIVARLAHACGAATLTWTHVRKLFDEMAGVVPAFKGAEWGVDARPIQLRWAQSRG
jgi:NADH-quinone oxidoreductase subunit G